LSTFSIMSFAEGVCAFNETHSRKTGITNFFMLLVL
jgi:hypothetical protein